MKNFYFNESEIKFRVKWYVYCIFSTYVKSEIAIYENFRFSPVFPVSPILIYSSFDSQSFSLSSGKISCQNNTDIVWGRPTSGLDFRPEVENIKLYNFRVNSKAPRASPSNKIADCELSNSYLLTHKIFSSNRFFKFFWIA